MRLVKNAFGIPGASCEDGYSTIGLRPAGSQLPSVVVVSVWETASAGVSKKLSDYASRGSTDIGVVILLVWKFLDARVLECQAEVGIRGSSTILGSVVQPIQTVRQSPPVRTSCEMLSRLQTFTTRLAGEELPSFPLTVDQLFGKHLPPELWTGMKYELSLKLLCQTAADMLETEIEEHNEELESKLLETKPPNRRASLTDRRTIGHFVSIISSIMSPPTARLQKTRRPRPVSSPAEATLHPLRHTIGIEHLKRRYTVTKPPEVNQPKKISSSSSGSKDTRNNRISHAKVSSSPVEAVVQVADKVANAPISVAPKRSPKHRTPWSSAWKAS